MKNLILISLLFFSVRGFCQSTYNSSITTKYKLDREVIEKQRSIKFSDTEIIITNWSEGTQPLNLEVNDIKEKENKWNGLMKWYYCVDKNKDALSGKYNDYIITIEKTYPTEIEVYQKVDEVNFINTTLNLE